MRVREYNPRTVARICKVAPRTVEKWAATGRLVARKDASGETRVARADLATFLHAHGMDHLIPTLPE